MSEETKSASPKAMSKTERQTLIRLVKQRFKLLETGLRARRSQLEAGILEELREEKRDEIEAFKERYRIEIVEPMQELAKVMDAWQDDVQKAGLAYANTFYIARDLSEIGRSRPTLEPADMHGEVQRRLKDKTGDVPLTRYALELEESKLVEELLVGDLTSDDAQAFMDRVPDVDKLLPLANSAAALQIEADEETQRQLRRRRY